jgi:hypothetical protein
MPGAVVSCPRVSGDGEGAGVGVVEGVEVDVGYAPVERDRIVGHREGQSDGVIGADDAVLAGGDRGTRLAAAIDGMKGGGLGGGSDGDVQVDVTQVPTRARRTRARWSRPEACCSGGTRRRWRSRRRRSRSWGIPLGQQPDEEDGVDGLGNVGVAEPDLIAAFLAPGAQESRQGQFAGICKDRPPDPLSLEEAVGLRVIPLQEARRPGLGERSRRRSGIRPARGRSRTARS